jgi:hypothetical protein
MKLAKICELSRNFPQTFCKLSRNNFSIVTVLIVPFCASFYVHLPFLVELPELQVGREGVFSTYSSKICAMW